MGAKTWMLVYSNSPVRAVFRSRPALDRAASTALAGKLFPSHSLHPLEDGTLSFTCPPDDEIVVACFPGVSIVATAELAIDYPSKLPRWFLDQEFGATIHLHLMHSAVDWFAFAIWHNRKLLRSLSLSPDSGVLEDIGQKMEFELPYWAGEHPAVDPDEEGNSYPFPFHPLELGEAALAEFFGYHLEGEVDLLLDPEDIPVMRFKKAKPRWKMW